MTKSIAVAGKGGTGKSTIAALIVSYLREHNMGPILAIDADPDSNMGALLGIGVNKTLGELREETLVEMKALPPGMSKASYIEAGLHQIIEEANGFDLLTMGRGEGPGCYCYLNTLLRKFSDDLFPSYKWIVMDNEAGLEHISRRTTTNIDLLLLVVNDNPISLNTAKTIEKVTRELKNKIAHRYVVTNMVKTERKSEVEKRIRELKIHHLCDIPWDSQVEELVFHGESLDKLQNSPAKECIHHIIKKLGGENGDT